MLERYNLPKYNDNKRHQSSKIIVTWHTSKHEADKLHKGYIFLSNAYSVLLTSGIFNKTELCSKYFTLTWIMLSPSFLSNSPELWQNCFNFFDLQCKFWCLYIHVHISCFIFSWPGHVDVVVDIDRFYSAQFSVIHCAHVTSDSE